MFPLDVNVFYSVSEVEVPCNSPHGRARLAATAVYPDVEENAPAGVVVLEAVVSLLE